MKIHDLQCGNVNIFGLGGIDLLHFCHCYSLAADASATSRLRYCM